VFLDVSIIFSLYCITTMWFNSGLLELLLVVLVVVLVYPFLNSLAGSLIGTKHSGLVTVVAVVASLYVFKMLQVRLL